MKFAVLLGFTALVAIQAAAVPSPEPENIAGEIAQILHDEGKHKHQHHKHHHHKHHKHLPKPHLGEKRPNERTKHAHPLGDGFCGLPGTFCMGGKRDVGTLSGYEEGYCGAPGSPCNTIKRTGWAIADVLGKARSVTDSPSFDGAPGTPGALAEEAIDAIAAKARAMYSAVYDREAEAFAEADDKTKQLGGDSTSKSDPEDEAWENGELGVCGASDTPCLAARDANPTKHAHPLGDGFCGLSGTFCMGGQRDAAPEPIKHAHPLGDGFCGLPGTFCMGGKRDAAPQPLRAREAAPVPIKHAHPLGDGFCGLPGTFCMGGKRDAAPEPVKHAHPLGDGFCGLPGTFCMGGKRDAAPEPVKHAHPFGDGFCGLPGTFCMGGRSAKAIARAVNETDPTWLKKECHQEGHACNTIYKIHKVFQNTKNEAKKFQKIKDPLAKFEAGCGKEGAAKCGYLTWAHQFAKKHNKSAADKVEQWCDSKGICTDAKRGLDELESTIDAAVAAVQAAA